MEREPYRLVEDQLVIGPARYWEESSVRLWDAAFPFSERGACHDQRRLKLMESAPAEPEILIDELLAPTQTPLQIIATISKWTTKAVPNYRTPNAPRRRAA